MAAFVDRVKETSTTTGTGNITLAGAVTGYQSFNAAVGLNREFYYCIAGQSGAEWEVGQAYLTGSTTMVRDVVYSSSNSNALVSFSAGTKDVFITIPATQAIDKGLGMALRMNLAMQ